MYVPYIAWWVLHMDPETYGLCIERPPHAPVPGAYSYVAQRTVVGVCAADSQQSRFPGEEISRLRLLPQDCVRRGWLSLPL